MTKARQEQEGISAYLTERKGKREREKEKFISSFIKRDSKLPNIIAGVTFFLSHCYRFLRTA